MRVMAFVMLALLTPAALAAQGRGPDPDRRAELEQRVRQQMLAQMAERLELTAEQRERVHDVLAEGAEARRELALESRDLRVALMQAVRDEDAPMSRFEEILEQLDAIRGQERALEEQEDSALAEILDPRQRAVILMMRMQFNDRVREMRGGRGMSPGGGHPGGSPGPPGTPRPFS